MKQKISPFEFAIMQIADPEKAKQYEPFTKQEVKQQRHNNLFCKIKKFKIIK